MIDAWPLPRKAAQVIVVPALGAGVPAIHVAVGAGAGGVLLIGAQPPAAQLKADLAQLRGLTGPAPFVMVDQEGGGVQRLGGDVTSMPWPRQMAATMTTGAVQQLARKAGEEMRALGVDVDLAPVLDLDGGPDLSATDPDGPRSFSTDPSIAAAYGQAFAAGLGSAGVLAVIKHFPGLGGATGNTDYGPAATPSLSALDAAGLIPFRRLVAGGARAVMVSNATVPGLSAEPASLSAAVITGLLRRQLGFSGLVVTDSLSAGAISQAGFTVPAAAVAAVEAGADMVLFGSTLTAQDAADLAPGPLAAQTAAVTDAITQAVRRGSLPESRLDDAVLHVVEAKGVNLCPTG